MNEITAVETGGQPSVAFSIAGENAANTTLLLAGLAAAKLLLQLGGIRHYGFFRDELYYMACGQHLAWGYVDQPPLVAFLAWFSRHLLGTSIVALRILPSLAGAALVFLTGVFARELGGGRFAQLLAATAVLLAPAYLAFDSFFSMNAFEPIFWLLCAWIVLRIVKGGSPKLWLAFGAVAGIGLENKHTMLVCGFALAGGLLLSGEGRVFSSRWIWIGGALAVALFLPNLLWEAFHGWPQVTVVRNAQEFKNLHIGPLRFLADEILFLHPLALPVWLGGLVWYFRTPGKRFRFLGWAYLIALSVFLALNGKSYYLLPAFPPLLAAGGVAFEEFASRPRRRLLRIAYPLGLLLGGLATVPFGVPLLPVQTFVRYSHMFPYARGVRTERDPPVQLPQLYADMMGWHNMAVTVARVYHALPKSEQASCAILAGNYGEAGAIDYYGPTLGLPHAISGHNSYFYWGPRGYSGACVILFGESADRYKYFFGEARRVATVVNPYSMAGEQQVPVYLCRRPRAPLSVLWPNFKIII